MTDNVPVRGDFPSNSRKTKPAVERVVKTPARIDKGSLGKQALRAFFAEDIREVGQYLLWDIALPGSTVYSSGVTAALSALAATRPTPHIPIGLTDVARLRPSGRTLRGTVGSTISSPSYSQPVVRPRMS